MAKRSKIARNDQRAAVVARYAERRAELKRVVASPSSSPEETAAAVRELQRQPRDASTTRVRNRDVVDGRPRGYLRKFGLSASACASRRTAASCPESRSRAGDGGRPARRPPPVTGPARRTTMKKDIHPVYGPSSTATSPPTSRS